jgi:hypothetical protein
MKALYTLLTLFVFAGFVSSCSKQTIYVKGDYLIVGRSGGMVPEDTKVKYYLIRNGQLYMDSNLVVSNIPESMDAFNFNCTMPEADSRKVADLPSAIPAELVGRNNENVGKAMFCDGQLDVRTVINGVAYRWNIQGDQNASSPILRQFVNRLNSDFQQ